LQHQNLQSSPRRIDTSITLLIFISVFRLLHVEHWFHPIWSCRHSFQQDKYGGLKTGCRQLGRSSQPIPRLHTSEHIVTATITHKSRKFTRKKIVLIQHPLFESNLNRVCTNQLPASVVQLWALQNFINTQVGPKEPSPGLANPATDTRKPGEKTRPMLEPKY